MSNEDDTHKWNEAFARLTREEQEQIREDQTLYGRAAIYSKDGITRRVQPDAIIDTRTLRWGAE